MELCVDVEIYGAELEYFGSPQDDLKIRRRPATKPHLGWIENEDLGELSPIPLRLPLLSVRGTDDFNVVVARVANDLREASGQHAIDHFEVQFPE